MIPVIRPLGSLTHKLKLLKSAFEIHEKLLIYFSRKFYSVKTAEYCVKQIDEKVHSVGKWLEHRAVTYVPPQSGFETRHGLMLLECLSLCEKD